MKELFAFLAVIAALVVLVLFPWAALGAVILVGGGLLAGVGRTEYFFAKRDGAPAGVAFAVVLSSIGGIVAAVGALTLWHNSLEWLI